MQHQIFVAMRIIVIVATLVGLGGAVHATGLSGRVVLTPGSPQFEMHHHLAKHLDYRSKCVAPAISVRWKDDRDGKMYWKCEQPKRH